MYISCINRLVGNNSNSSFSQDPEGTISSSPEDSRVDLI